MESGTVVRGRFARGRPPEAVMLNPREGTAVLVLLGEHDLLHGKDDAGEDRGRLEPAHITGVPRNMNPKRGFLSSPTGNAVPVVVCAGDAYLPGAGHDRVTGRRLL